MPRVPRITARSGGTGATKPAKAKKNTDGDLGFEATLWSAADQLRGSMDASEYKHPVLGLIFLKYISFDALMLII